MKEFSLMNWQNIAIIGLFVFVFAQAWVKAGKDKKAVLIGLVYQVALQVEKEIKNSGYNKLVHFKSILRQKINSMPVIARILIKCFISEEKIEEWLEEAVKYINYLQSENKKEMKAQVTEKAKEVAKIAVEKVVNKAIDSKYNRNPNLTDNGTINVIGKQVKDEIKKGEIIAYVRAGMKQGIETGADLIYKF